MCDGSRGRGGGVDMGVWGGGGEVEQLPCHVVHALRGASATEVDSGDAVCGGVRVRVRDRDWAGHH